MAGGSTTASNCSKSGNSPAAVLCDSGSCRDIGRGEELEGLHGNEAKPLRWLARAGAQQGGTATAEQDALCGGAAWCGGARVLGTAEVGMCRRGRGVEV